MDCIVFNVTTIIPNLVQQINKILFILSYLMRKFRPQKKIEKL